MYVHMKFTCTQRKKNVWMVYPKVESFRKREYLALGKKTHSIFRITFYVRFVPAADALFVQIYYYTQIKTTSLNVLHVIGICFLADSRTKRRNSPSNHNIILMHLFFYFCHFKRPEFV